MATKFNSLFGQAASRSEKVMEKSHVRACTNCVRAKAKCFKTISVDDEGKCERCHRMKKICQPSPPVRRPRTLKRPSAHETSKLEEKLDGLVTLLKSATQGAPGILNTTLVNSSLEGLQPASHETSSISAAISRDYQAHNRPSPNGSGPHESIYTPTTSTFSKSTPLNSLNAQPVLHPGLEPSPEDAELYLNRFRNDFVKHFPFVIISPSVTAHELRQERPILWISIMTVASSHSTQQISLSNEVRGILAREAFVQGTRNMDLLLAILVYATWDRRFCFGRPLLISLIQLAIAILYDLGLDKPPSKDPALSLAFKLKGAGNPPALSRTPTMEERRVLLSCFLMTSVSSSTFRKGSTLRWTVYSNECLRIVETEKEFESDALLVQLVKLRLISERVNDLPLSPAVAEVDTTARAPTMFYLKSLEAQLQAFKSNIPSNLSNNKTLLMEFYMTEFSIYEVGLSQAPDTFSGPDNRRIECLWVCLNAIKSWIDVFLSITPAQYVGFSSLIYSNMTHCLVGMCRLSMFEHVEWDRALFREHLDVVSILEKTEKNFASVKDEAGLDIGGSEDTDFFSSMASKIRVLKGSWDYTSASTMTSTGMPSNDELDLPDFPMEFSDEDWLRNVLGPWNQ
ncbi:hypothetical protein V1520DRAFT_345197 [Lipomyces starkeyi]